MGTLQLRTRLLASGWSDDEVRRLLRTGELSPVRRGAYVRGTLPSDPAHRHLLDITAAVAHLSPDVVISHGSAAVLHGLPLWGVPLGRVHGTRNRGTGGRRGSRVHVHTAPLPPAQIALADGVPVTDVARTVVDVARTVGFEQAVVVADAALATGLVTGEELAEAVLRATGWPGAPAARRAIAFADAGAKSPGESRSRVAMSEAGLPAPILQWEVLDGGRSLGFADFGWPRLRTVGEFDGQIKYGRLLRPGQSPGDVVFAEKRREDRMRDTDLGMARWTWDELGPAFTPVADRIRRRFRAV